MDHTFSSFGGLWGTIKAMVFNTYANPGAKKRLAEEAKRPHGPLAQLVQLGIADQVQSAQSAQSDRIGAA